MEEDGESDRHQRMQSIEFALAHGGPNSLKDKNLLDGRIETEVRLSPRLRRKKSERISQTSPQNRSRSASTSPRPRLQNIWSPKSHPTRSRENSNSSDSSNSPRTATTPSPGSTSHSHSNSLSCTLSNTYAHSHSSSGSQESNQSGKPSPERRGKYSPDRRSRPSEVKPIIPRIRARSGSRSRSIARKQLRSRTLEINLSSGEISPPYSPDRQISFKSLSPSVSRKRGNSVKNILKKGRARAQTLEHNWKENLENQSPPTPKRNMRIKRAVSFGEYFQPGDNIQEEGVVPYAAPDGHLRESDELCTSQFPQILRTDSTTVFDFTSKSTDNASKASKTPKPRGANPRGPRNPMESKSLPSSPRYQEDSGMGIRGDTISATERLNALNPEISLLSFLVGTPEPVRTDYPHPRIGKLEGKEEVDMPAVHGRSKERSFKFLTHQFPSVNEKVETGFLADQKMDGFFAKLAKIHNDFGEELEKLASSYLKRLDSAKKRKSKPGLARAAMREALEHVYDMGKNEQQMASRIRPVSDHAASLRATGKTAHAEIMKQERRLSEVIQLDLEELEKVRARASKSLDAATLLKAQHDVAKAQKNRRYVESMQRSQKSGKWCLPDSAMHKLEKMKHKAISKQSQAHDVCSEYSIKIDKINHKLYEYHNTQLPNLLLQLEALDAKRILNTKRSFSEFANLQEELELKNMESIRGFTSAIESIDPVMDQEAFVSDMLETYGVPADPRHIEYDLARTPTNILSVENDIRTDYHMQPTLDYALHDNPLLESYFKRCLVDSYSMENLQFYRKVQDYQTIKDPDIRKRRAKEIYDLFICEEGEFTVNIRSETRENIEKNLDAASPYVFDEAYASAKALMKNHSFPQFLNGPFYEEYLEMTT